jgi:DNA-binding CsgD family transcriptional regulator
VATLQAAEGLIPAERGLELLRGAGQPADVVQALMYRGLATLYSGRYAEACRLFEEALELCRSVGHRWVEGRLLAQLGYAHFELGDLRASRFALEDGLRLSVELRDWYAIPVGLSGFAGLAARTGRPRRALRLAAAAEAIAAEHEFVNKAREVTVERWLRPARAAVGRAAPRVEAEGRALGMEEAVAMALADEAEEPRGLGGRHTLTPREREVAGLVARGLTNRDIAARLHLSVRTVDVHVDHVLTKLGFHNRTRLVSWAYEEGLLRRNTYRDR